LSAETAAFLLHMLSLQHLDPTAADFEDIAAQCAQAARELRAVIDLDA